MRCSQVEMFDRKPIKTDYRYENLKVRHNIPGLKMYLEKGILPGDFLQAVICDKLHKAVMYADSDNLRNLPDIVSWFNNYVPHLAFGSEENMHRWCEEIKEKLSCQR